MSSSHKRVRVLYPDHLGLHRGKYIPAGLVQDNARFCMAVFALTFDRTMSLDASASKVLEGLPDFDVKFDFGDVRPSWESHTGVVIGDSFFHGHPLKISPRHVLKKAIADWKHLGYDVNVGIELEAFVLQPDGNGGWTEWDTPGAYVYGTGPAVDPIGLFDEIMEVANSVGLPVESINSEYDTPQFELTLRFSDALRAVDEIFLFKLMAREIAMKHSLRLTFMGQPFGDRGGSGFHVNFSLKTEENSNVFYDPASEDGISAIAKQCIAGLVAKHESMALFCASTVNAYKRLKPGQLSGYWANWGYDHRGVTIRIPHERGKATRLEHRMGDGAANPYLATAAVLQAARLGLVNQIPLPEAERLDCLESQSTDRHTPNTLGEACDVLLADAELVDAVGREMAEHLAIIKRAEWAKYTEACPDWESLGPQITDWELKFYQPFL